MIDVALPLWSRVNDVGVGDNEKSGAAAGYHNNLASSNPRLRRSTPRPRNNKVLRARQRYRCRCSLFKTGGGAIVVYGPPATVLRFMLLGVWRRTALSNSMEPGCRNRSSSQPYDLRWAVMARVAPLNKVVIAQISEVSMLGCQERYSSVNRTPSVFRG